jgi:hypothetical protein
MRVTSRVEPSGDVRDDFPDRSLDEFAAELRLLLAPLHGLAKAGGGRLLARHR